MNVGTIAYEVNSGLGRLAKDFYDHGVVNRVMVMDHAFYTRKNWYPANVRFTSAQSRNFLKGLDALLLFENVFTRERWQIVSTARSQGIKVVLMPMYEYTPKPLPVPVDLYICPSLLDQQYYKDLPNVFIPVPVEREFIFRERALVFVHNAGHGGFGYRNGTVELLNAIHRVKSPIKLIVRAQPDSSQMVKLFRSHKPDPRVDLRLVEEEYKELYREGDVFIFPEKFNGLSLPLQEAYASGMLVMATDRFPMNTWLPKEPLLPVRRYVKDHCIPSVEFDKADVNSMDIAAKIDEWYEKDISGYSMCGYYWAQEHSWEKLKPRYLEALSKKR